MYNDSEGEGFLVTDRSFDYLLYERAEFHDYYKQLPEANRILNRKPPPTNNARVIKGFGLT